MSNKRNLKLTLKPIKRMEVRIFTLQLKIYSLHTSQHAEERERERVRERETERERERQREREREREREIRKKKIAQKYTIVNYV